MKLLLISIVISLLSCAGTIHPKGNTLMSLRITKLFPDIDQRGKFKGFDTTIVDLYFYGDFRIYRMPGRQDTIINGLIQSLGMVDGYLIHHKDSLYGRMFHQIFREYNKRVRIETDTYITKFSDLHLQEVFEGMNMQLLNSRSSKDSGTLKEVYHFMYSVDTSQKGLLSLDYSHEFDNIPFHLSPYIDSIKGSKLYHYKMVTFGRPVARYKIVLDTLVASVHMERINNPHKDKIMELIEMYMKDRSH